MTIRKLLSSLAILALCAATGFAGYATREKWLPRLFPEKKTAGAAKHGHDCSESCCSERANTEKVATKDHVHLSRQAQRNLKLDVDLLTPEPYWRSLLIPGVVVDRPGESDRSVTARAAGVVTAIHAKPGDTVKAGEALFDLQLVSEAVQAAQLELAKAARELTIAGEKRDRTAARVKDKLLPEESLLEDEAAVKRFTTLAQGLRRQLQAFGLTPPQIDRAAAGEFTTQVTIAAPAAPERTIFEIEDLKAHLGDTVQAGQSLAVLSGHQRLYVEGQAFKSEATALAKLIEGRTAIRAEFADEPAGEWPEQPLLTIHHLSNVVDPATRTFAFYLALENQPRSFERDGRTHYIWRYRPGQRVRLRVPVEKVGDAVLVLPAGAIIHEGAETYAFIQNGDEFVRKPVRVLFEDRRDAVLADDGSLPAGAFVVRNQAAAILRALKADSGTGHEGHDHNH